MTSAPLELGLGPIASIERRPWHVGLAHRLRTYRCDAPRRPAVRRRRDADHDMIRPLADNTRNRIYAASIFLFCSFSRRGQPPS